MDIVEKIIGKDNEITISSTAKNDNLSSVLIKGKQIVDSVESFKEYVCIEI